MSATATLRFREPLGTPTARLYLCQIGFPMANAASHLFSGLAVNPTAVAQGTSASSVSSTVLHTPGATCAAEITCGR
jgi:hypothetical protein